MRIGSFLAAVVAVGLAGAGCGGGSDDRSPAPSRPAPATSSTTAPPDPAAVRANELGVVPVVMYHRIVPVVKGEYDRTPDDFRAELLRLFEAKFRPVTAQEYVEGTMPVEAGLSPVVLTFDDSTRDQFALTPAGEVDPASAVGILIAFASSHPGFRPIATLYVNDAPFGVTDTSGVLRKLHDLGFELGDHTATHANLGKLDAAGVQHELVLGQQVITSAVPDASPQTMALPFGVRPTDRSLVLRGADAGGSYAFKGAFLVGAGPAPSPFAATFDPAGIPRIRSSSWDGGPPNFGTGYWLDWFDQHPDRRFVADGNPAAVSFPRARAADLAPAFATVGRPYDAP